MAKTLIFLIIIAALLVIMWYIATSNELKRAVVKVEEALSDIDVALIKRYDVLVKMLDISKSYAKYEKETILETIHLRSNMSMADRNNAAKEMNQADIFLNAVAENYPELKSSENFKQLQLSVMNCEEHLQAARRVYNSNISYLNQKIVSFPSSVVANRMQLNSKEFIEIEAYKKQDVKMEF
ncbi:MAG: LemA family protein [Mobilitalea sp.]